MKLTAAILYKLIFAAVAAEAPWLPSATSARAAELRGGIEELSSRVVFVAEDDRLGEGPDVEAALLAGILLFESRFQPRPDDGDCEHGWHRLVHTPRGLWPKDYVPGFERKCRSAGPMQINKEVGGWLRWLPDVGERWPYGIDEQTLRNPELNVALGRDLLVHWKNECGSAVPGAWMTAWQWGDCPKKKNARISEDFVDREGTRRCAVATAILDRARVRPAGWECGDKDRKLDDYGKRFVRAILAAPL